MGQSEKLLIGIHVHTRPADLAATLNALRWNTGNAFDAVLLVDGPDDSLSQALPGQSHLAQSLTTEARGAAACFNRLVAHADADWYVFLESGGIAGPGWWRHIVNALRARQTHGLAGPSTNSAWNEQCVFPTSSTAYTTVLLNAFVASRTYGSTWKTLEPLYSLADFCYVVGRDVVRAVGAADEGYGLGPCWEMDYSIRAARAGFDGVWARGAYVHRLPWTERRRMLEPRLIDASRMRYQDKFCALRLNGQSNTYESHCKGDACEHFAPPTRIRVNEALISTAGVAAPSHAEARPVASCVMVTGGRPDFVGQAVQYFHQQDFESKELLIIDDGPQDLSERFDHQVVRYRHLRTRASIGAKRNLGCELARGDFIVHWDDDDWYSSRRLSYQLTPLLEGNADISALRVETFWDLANWRFWRCSADVHRRMFVEDVQGGTLAFRRNLWQRGLRFPDVSLAEDADFLKLAIRYGARLARLESNGNYIYVRHGANAWSFVCGEVVDPKGWTQIQEPLLMEADRQFYRSMAQQRHHISRIKRDARSHGS
ncbi:glycosyltransferase [Caballeronia sp. LZ029]|uniref:glycosyltransferase n=1 Tax=Caballeronia sp. LZ029 TaxID=3038564 RepID=UPI0028546370|nr:glycosyltransferase [Caballeronia sp. LZ029]MDR5748832.1 glycosyltransferase [Caballeronia sp. LZ029]